VNLIKLPKPALLEGEG